MRTNKTASTWIQGEAIVIYILAVFYINIVQ